MYVFIRLRTFPSVLGLSDFIMKECWVLSVTSSMSVEVVCVVFCPLLIWYLTLIFLYVEATFCSWNKFHLVMVYNLFLYASRLRSSLFINCIF